VRFIIPTLAFTIVLLVVFLFTIILAFRQKKLTEMKNDFINNMTHEIKTPITSISLAAQMLGDPSLPKSQTMLSHLSQVITTESKRLRLLAERVLLLSMFDNSQININLKDVDANEVIDGIAQNFKIRAEKSGGSITCELNAENANVVVDTMHFTNVIYNLLDNALKYQREEEPIHINITTENTGENMLTIKVADNGVGIKRDDLKRIFDRFYRVSTGNRHDVKGFGIGLAYVRQVVNQIGGTIKVDSEYGKGTTFSITLPIISDHKSDHDSDRDSDNNGGSEEN
jgi:signal transduction histidine kinase